MPAQHILKSKVVYNMRHFYTGEVKIKVASLITKKLIDHSCINFF